MNLKQFLNVEATAGISTLHPDVLMLPKLMEEANAAAERKNIYPSGKVFYYEDRVAQENVSIVQWMARVDEYVRELKANLGEALPIGTDALLADLREREASEELFNSCFGMLVYRLYGLLLEYGHADGTTLHRFDPDVFFRNVPREDKLAQLGRYLEEAARMAQLLVRERDQSIVARMTGFIREHYRNPALKIQDIATEVHFSTAYLSYLFKKETGTNVWDYVTGLRIEEAKRLLATTDKKRYEVAYEVGYESPEHFGRMFKRYTGLSPAEYRKEGQGGSG
jgi:two-component system response regulator YesN